MNTYKRTNADTQLQEDLAAYGIMREYADGRARKASSGKPDFFGLQETGSGYDTQFRADPRDIDDNMTLSLVAPEDEPFNMLVTRDFKKAVQVSDPKDIKEYLHRLLDEV